MAKRRSAFVPSATPGSLDGQGYETEACAALWCFQRIYFRDLQASLQIHSGATLPRICQHRDCGAAKPEIHQRHHFLPEHLRLGEFKSVRRANQTRHDMIRRKPRRLHSLGVIGNQLLAHPRGQDPLFGLRRRHFGIRHRPHLVGQDETVEDVIDQLLLEVVL